MQQEETGSHLVFHHEVSISTILILEALRDAVGVVALPDLANQMVPA